MTNPPPEEERSEELYAEREGASNALAARCRRKTWATKLPDAASTG